MNEVYIFDAVRTPQDMRSEDNPYLEIKPVDLLARTFTAIVERIGFDPSEAGDALIGMVGAGEHYGINIARAALLKAGWPASVSGVTLNRNSASSLSAINLAAAKILAGLDHFCLAGGVDRHNTPPQALFQGAGPISDPEWLARTGYIPPPLAADLLATIQGISREEADRYALQSFEKAAKALESGFLTPSLMELSDRNGLPLLSMDALRWTSPGAADLAGMDPLNQGLPSPGFEDIALGRYPEVERVKFIHTRGNSSPRADGAALLLLGSSTRGKALGLKPLARIVAMSHTCTEPTLMFQGAVEAARKCLHAAGMEKGDIGLWRCNEPFASVGLHFQRSFDIPDERLNLGGGSIAFGKAIAAGGAILAALLLCELENEQLGTGLVAVASEGGIGTALLVEKL